MEKKEELLRQLFHKIAKEQNYENYELIIDEISSNGANFMAKLFTGIIREENKEDLHLFAKVATAGEAMRSEFPGEFYDTEVYAYQKLAKIYAALEEENGVPEEHRLKLIKCYGFEASKNQEILVLENLIAVGYGPHDRFKSYDWQYAYSAVKDMAKLHALSFAFSEKDPEEFKKTLEVLKMDWNKSESLKTVMKSMVNIALKVVEPEYKDALAKFLEDKPPAFTMTGAIGRPVIIHGEFRGNNLLHREREDGKVDIKVLDLQTMHGGSPVSDLVCFIFTGSDEEFRAKYYEKLLDHYYSELSAAMKRLNLDPEKIFSRKDFDFEMKEKLAYGLTIAVFMLPVLTIDSENAPVADESMDFTSFAIDKPSDLLKERLNGVINDFVKWGVLK